MATATASAGDVWTRKYLNDRGYTDDQIQFDQGRNMVTAGGLDFFSPTKVANGMSYGSKEQLDSAFNNLQQTKGQKTSNELMSQLTQALAKPFEIQPFNYNPQTDQQYIQGMQIADQNAAQATGNALASLASRGIENGSIMGDRATQIQQQERSRVSAELVPQLMSQAYNRYANEQSQRYQANQDQLAGIAQLLGVQLGQNQQFVDNRYRDKNANLDAALAVGSASGKLIDPKQDWSLLFSQAANPNTALNLAGSQAEFSNEMAQKQFAEDVRQFGLQYALSKMSTNNSIANANADNGRQASNAEFNRLMDIWAAQGGKPPAGLVRFGVDPNAEYKAYTQSGGSSKTVQYDQTPEWAQEIAALNADPEGSYNEYLNNSSDYISAYGYDGYLKLLNQAKTQANR